MKLLELFSGTKSVGKVAEKLGYEVISLDLKDADINCNILDWDYTTYPVGYFDVIWASPPCDTFSSLKCTWIGKYGYTRESIQNDIDNIGLPILRRTEEIIDYLKPKYYFMENPQTGKMKHYINDKPYYDVDYCKYSDWGYRKRTRIWTNLIGFIPKVCKRDCNNMVGNKHRTDVSTSVGGGSNRLMRYRIPPQLIEELFNCMDLDLR